MLGIAAHTGGWPMPEGGAQAITDALVSYLTSLGVEVVTGWPVSSLADLPPSPLVLLDTAPAEAVRILGHHMAPLRRVQLGRFRHGLGVFKVDYALSEPVPWAAQEVSRAGTVHVGGTLAEIAAAEDEVTRGRHASRPFVLVVQPTLFDSTRAPAGRHTLWAYCHVPNGSAVDMTTPIEHQIERFAPGFGDIVLARHTTDTAQMQASNRNHVGGDISGGANDGLQLLFRPRLALDPYFLGAGDGRTVYLCSASTPPGGGVHGMCGYHAARLALRRLRPR
ncbi:MAG: phytoene desaturase family protein [Acidimicrobiia bacterium]